MAFDVMIPFRETLEAVSLDNDTRVVVITGAGHGFCSGADLEDSGIVPNIAGLTPTTIAHHALELLDDVILAIRKLHQPVIGAINGAAIGGGFCLACACDIRVASPQAYFRAAGINNGLTASELGISYLFPREVGAVARLRDHAHRPRRRRRGSRTHRAGVEGCGRRAALLDECYAMAEPIIGYSRIGVELTKRMLWSSLDASSIQRTWITRARRSCTCASPRRTSKKRSRHARRSAPRYSVTDPDPHGSYRGPQRDVRGWSCDRRAGRISFDAVAAQYDAARPEYPPELYDTLVELTGITKESRLLEVGPGPGIATARVGRTRLSDHRARAGREHGRVARRALAAFPTVEVVQGDFENVGPRRPSTVRPHLRGHGLPLDRTYRCTTREWPSCCGRAATSPFGPPPTCSRTAAIPSSVRSRMCTTRWATCTPASTSGPHRASSRTSGAASCARAASSTTCSSTSSVGWSTTTSMPTSPCSTRSRPTCCGQQTTRRSSTVRSAAASRPATTSSCTGAGARPLHIARFE